MENSNGSSLLNIFGNAKSASASACERALILLSTIYAFATNWRNTKGRMPPCW